jgi:hypothetical protein
VPHLIESGITYVQHADDKIIFLEIDEPVANLKFLLYCFESMSSLKINYAKTELVVVGADMATNQ